MTGRLPSFLIVGAMRSGTTSLYRYLVEHPNVFLPGIKEVHFFDDKYDLGLTWYSDQFSKGVSFRQVGEATPNYMYDPVAIERIGHDLPRALLVLILRNPVDRAYSHYLHNRVRGKERLSFEDALAAEPQRLVRSPVDRRMYSYADRGRYLPQLSAIFKEFPPASVSVLVFDDLVRDPRSVVRRVCEFLDVDPKFEPQRLGIAVNAYVEFRSIWIRRMSKKLPRPVRRLVGHFNAKSLSRPLERPSEKTQEMLCDALIGDVRATSELIGRDLASLWFKERHDRGST
jgi:hypothetical protein